MERRRTALALALVMSASILVSACGRRATPVPTPTPTAPPVTATSPAADDWARVRASGRLMVGSSLDNPPLSMYNNVLQPDGFEIALMKEIGRRLSLQVEFNDFAFEGLLSALQLNQVDAVIAAMSITPERQQEVDFTNPYFIGEDAILAAADSSIAAVATVNDLAARRVGVQRGSVYESWLRDTLVATGQMPQFNLLTYISLDEAIRDLRDGRVELVALDLAPAQHYAELGSVSVIAQNLHPQRFGIAVQKGSSLLPQLNQALQQVQADGTVGRLLVEFNLFSAPLPPPEPTPTPAPTATPAANTPVPATAAPPACLDGMAWVSDLTLDDKDMTAPPVMQPGQAFQKGWRIRNTGNCPWSSDFALTYVSGNSNLSRMGGRDQPIGQVVRPGDSFDVFVNLVAPQAPGIYQGFWQMVNSSRVPFGERVWVGITVPGGATPTPRPTQTPAADISFSADRTAINAGECVVFRWNVQNVNAVFFYQQGQPYRNFGVAGVDSRTMCPPSTTTFELRVERRDGSVEVRQITIAVSPVPGAPVITQFNTVPEFEVNLGACVNLSWSAQGNITRVTLSRNGAMLWDHAPVNGSTQDCPTPAGHATYELQAIGPGGTGRTQRSVQVRESPAATATPIPPTQPGAPSIIRLSATEEAPLGSCVWVSWELGSGTTNARLYRNGLLYADNAHTANNIAAFSGNANGDCATDTVGPIVYRLEASNAAGVTAVQEVTTEVVAIAKPF